MPVNSQQLVVDENRKLFFFFFSKKPSQIKRPKTCHYAQNLTVSGEIYAFFGRMRSLHDTFLFVFFLFFRHRFLHDFSFITCLGVIISNVWSSIHSTARITSSGLAGGGYTVSSSVSYSQWQKAVDKWTNAWKSQSTPCKAQRRRAMVAHFL